MFVKSSLYDNHRGGLIISILYSKNNIELNSHNLENKKSSNITNLNQTHGIQRSTLTSNNNDILIALIFE